MYSKYIVQNIQSTYFDVSEYIAYYRK
uniref:Uncharacterized protein n=1 Tax=Anguilla anguilla TaxID=7936 RepID=A0A0E9WL26_ANGAN